MNDRLAPPAPSPVKRAHVCNVCNKSFKRNEHCARHQRAHTQEKPYSCRYCRRRYSRKDLVVRHERTLHADEQAKESATAPTVEGAGAVSTEDTIVVDTSSTTTSPQVEHVEFVPRRTSHTDSNGQIEMDIDLDGGLQHPVKARQYSHTTHVPVAPSDFQALTRGESGGLDIGIDTSTHLGQFDFSAASNQDFLSSNNFEELDFFDLSGGLPPDQSMFLAFNGNSEWPDHFSPLEQASTHSPRKSVSDPTMRAGEAFNPGMHASRPGQVDAVKQHLPRIVKHAGGKPPNLVLDDTKWASLKSDLDSRLSAEQKRSFVLPTSTSLQKCLRTYFDSVHVHLPLFHLHTLDPASTPSPLILAMCAVGALFRLERKVAAALFAKADEALRNSRSDAQDEMMSPNSMEDWVRPRRGSEVLTSRPMWMTQCRLLLTFFAGFSGSPIFIRKAIEGMEILANDYRLKMPSVKAGRVAHNRVSSWHQWIERETTKRLLYGIFILSNLITITYGTPPVVSIVQDGEVEMPDEEALWAAPTEDLWRQRPEFGKLVTLPSLRDAVARLMYDKEVEGWTETSWNWAPFAVTVVMHAVSIQLWYVMQCTHSFSVFGAHDKPLSSLFTGHVETALARCHAMISREHAENDHNWIESEGPLMFNALAVLRVAYVRAFTGAGSFNRMALLNDDSEQILSAIREYVGTSQDRSPFLTKAVAQAFEGFVTPIKAGAMLVKKTAALSWSIEHAIAGWDCALFVTKWIHAMEKLQCRRIELDESEKHNLRSVYELLNEIGTEITPTTSLAAETTRVWAGFYDDTWVWGVTPKMGWLLRELATAYSNDLDAHRLRTETY